MNFTSPHFSYSDKKSLLSDGQKIIKFVSPISHKRSTNFLLINSKAFCLHSVSKYYSLSQFNYNTYFKKNCLAANKFG